MLRSIASNAIAIRGAPPMQPPAPTPGAADFRSVLKSRLDAPRPVRFSAHAAQRLEARNISLSPGQLESVGRAVDALDAKGARESLLLMDGVALVVSVPNRTVITAVSTREMSQTVFTQIDSAVVLGGDVPATAPTQWPAPERGGLPAADRLMRRPMMTTNNVSTTQEVT